MVHTRVFKKCFDIIKQGKNIEITKIRKNLWNTKKERSKKILHYHTSFSDAIMWFFQGKKMYLDIYEQFNSLRSEYLKEVKELVELNERAKSAKKSADSEILRLKLIRCKNLCKEARLYKQDRENSLTAARDRWFEACKAIELASGGKINLKNFVQQYFME